ncbi:MAG: arginase [Gammaproteobacteria bacterium]|nr:arginase [Gammaproteobacteria bacterium]
MKISRITEIIGVASGLGAPDIRCASGPETIQRLAHARNWLSVNSHWQWRATLVVPPGHGDVKEAADFFSKVAAEVSAAIHRQRFVGVYGGDHSCAIGTWGGVAEAIAARGRIGLIWIDAHMDSHTPQTSPSGELHGMPVACLLGKGATELCRIGKVVPRLLPQHLCLIGVRSYEGEEAQLLQQMGVKVYTMDDVHRMGMANVMFQAREHVSQGTAAYGVSIDLDSLDPLDAPGVGSPVVGGLHAEELIDALRPLRNDQKLVAMEIAELNPVMDLEQRTAMLALDLLGVVTGLSEETEHEQDH